MKITQSVLVRQDICKVMIVSSSNHSTLCENVQDQNGLLLKLFLSIFLKVYELCNTLGLSWDPHL